METYIFRFLTFIVVCISIGLIINKFKLSKSKKKTSLSETKEKLKENAKELETTNEKLNTVIHEFKEINEKVETDQEIANKDTQAIKETNKNKNKKIAEDLGFSIKK